MTTKTIPLLVSNYNKLTAKDAGVQRLLNVYLEERKDYVEEKTRMSMFRTPGYILWKDLSGGSIRGAIQHLDYSYWVVDEKVYKVASDTVVTLLGSMNSSAGRVFMTALNDEIVISDNTEAWSYKITAGTWAQITDADLPYPVGSIASLANRVIYCIRGTQKFYASDLEDGRAITATTNAAISLNYDDLQAVAVNLNNAYFFGDITTEIFAPVDDVTLPYDRISGGLLEFGIVSPYAWQRVLDSLYVIAKNKDGIVGLLKIDGLNVTLIKNDDFIEKVNTYVNNDNTFCWSFSDKGHHFLAVTFPVAESVTRGRTWIYDTTTSSWSELESNDTSNQYSAFLNRHTANCCIQFAGKQLIGDFQSGKIYEFSSDYYDEDGAIIRRQVVGPHIRINNNRLTISKISINVEGGIGLNNGGDYDSPKLNLSWSTDEGRTFCTPQERECGTAGQYKLEPLWSSAGSGRCFTFKLDFSDPVDWAIYDMYAKVRVSNG